jgi:hypothetical protein
VNTALAGTALRLDLQGFHLAGSAVRAGGFVSLHATARDRAGATIDQTLIRSIAIRR